jgi:hypothetical protein
MVPVGTHDIEMVNDALGFRMVQRVSVSAGQTTAVNVPVPSGTLSLNALPWAEVFVGDRRLGETPIANLELPIGRHEIVFRHPQFGERRETVLVTLREPARLGVDMRSREP